MCRLYKSLMFMLITCVLTTSCEMDKNAENVRKGLVKSIVAIDAQTKEQAYTYILDYDNTGQVISINDVKYERQGGQIKAQDGENSYTATLDAQGRAANVKAEYGVMQVSYNFNYDGAGYLATNLIGDNPSVDGAMIAYSYDESGNISELTNPGESHATILCAAYPNNSNIDLTALICMMGNEREVLLDILGKHSKSLPAYIASIFTEIETKDITYTINAQNLVTQVVITLEDDYTTILNIDYY